MKTVFDKRFDRLRKQIMNATNNLKGRQDKSFVKRSGHKSTGPFEKELKELTSIAMTSVQLSIIEELKSKMSVLDIDWIYKSLKD